MHRLSKPISEAVASEPSFVKAAVKTVSSQIFEEQVGSMNFQTVDSNMN